jgi:hypothetical protein
MALNRKGSTVKVILNKIQRKMWIARIIKMLESTLQILRYGTDAIQPIDI